MEGKRGRLREIKDYWDPRLPATRAALWSLPEGSNGEHKIATSNTFHFSNDQEILASRSLPLMRYADESSRRSQINHHPNNNGGWVDERGADETKVDDNGAKVDDDILSESSASEDHGDGGWVNESRDAAEAPSPRWRFEEDFAQCKVGHYCVGLNETSSGPSPYMFVGKIVAVNSENRTFRYKPLKCTADSWSAECLKKPWHDHRLEEDCNPHYSVMFYCKALTKTNKIPAAGVRKIHERNISWYTAA